MNLKFYSQTPSKLSFLIALIFWAGTALGSDQNVPERIKAIIGASKSGSFSVYGEPVYCAEAVREVYSNAPYPIWNQRRAEEFLSYVALSHLDGLIPTDYHLNSLTKAINPWPYEEERLARIEIALTDAFLLFTSHLLHGKLNPETLHPIWDISLADGNPKALLDYYRSGAPFEEILRAATPKKAEYRFLKMELYYWSQLQDQAWEIISIPESFKPGASHNQIIKIRRRVAIISGLPIAEFTLGANHSFYDSTLVNGVRKIQELHGLNPDGVIGPKTMRALNLTPAERVKMIKINLERWRWLERNLGDYYIHVNIAAYRLDLIDGGNKISTHRVIAGKPARQTPVFSSTMQYLVINPTWTVPPTILSKDVIPGIKKDPNYLSKKGIELYNSRGERVLPEFVDWTSPEAKRLIYRQPAGPDNALGDVKFMFPNKYSIYLHDTPSRSLFTQEDRALSSGCIRVQYPLKLAEILLDSENYSLPRLQEMVSERITRTIRLDRKPKVHLTYLTVEGKSDTEVYFLNDVYERDAAVWRGLQSTPPLL
ncbi:L,D-transpeptidase family protein [Luteibaculum oceani]|uniref:L,D-transpeptidase family protein n=1 Tax=Luteibaculum oceani TaxID=1294296 RepID=A0A5C6V1T2_9FLAO|nr:L,D-transpeptidase family protein [Luteibaculum oceani]TXC78800.1 L,D-transpeptidase family protein [Luteibaculum oceani]